MVDLPRDPWNEPDALRAAKGIGLGVLLAAVLWLSAFGFLLWAWLA